MKKRLQRAAAIGMAAILCIQNAQFSLTTFADELSDFARMEGRLNAQEMRATPADAEKDLPRGDKTPGEDSSTDEDGEIKENPDENSENQENEQDDIEKASDSNAKEEENSGLENTVKKDETKKFQIQSFEWGNPEEYPKGEPMIASVTEETRASFEELTEALPQEICAIVSEKEKVEDSTTDEDEEILQNDLSWEETIPIVSWTCPEYKTDEDGNWPLSGEFIFAAELPGEYEVVENCDAVEMTVVLDSEVMTLSKPKPIMNVNIGTYKFIYYDESSKNLSFGDASLQDVVSVEDNTFVLHLKNSNCSTWKNIQLLSGRWRIEVEGDVTLSSSGTSSDDPVLLVDSGVDSCIIQGNANSSLNISGPFEIIIYADTEIRRGVTVNVNVTNSNNRNLYIAGGKKFWVSDATFNLLNGKLYTGAQSEILIKSNGKMNVKDLEQDGYSKCTIEAGGTLSIGNTWSTNNSEITNNGTIILDGQFLETGRTNFTNNGEIKGNGSFPDKWKKTPQITRITSGEKVQRSQNGDTIVDLTRYFKLSNGEKLELKYEFESDSDKNGSIENASLKVPNGEKGTFKVYARTDGNNIYRAARSDLYTTIEIVDPVINQDDIKIKSYRGEYDGMPHDVAIIVAPEGARVQYNTKSQDSAGYDENAWTDTCPQITTPEENGRPYYVRVLMDGMQPYYHKESIQAYIYPRTLNEADCQVMYRGQLLSGDSTVVQELTYNGQPQSPEYDVYYNGIRLIPDVDYQRGYTRQDGNRIREGFTFGYSIYGTSGRYNMNIKKDSIFKIVPAPLENLSVDLVYVDGKPRLVPSSILEKDIDMGSIYISIRKKDEPKVVVSDGYIKKEDNYVIDTTKLASGDYIISYRFYASNYGDRTDETESTGVYQIYKTGELPLHIGPYEFAEDDLTIKLDGMDYTDTPHTYDGKSHTITVEPSEALTESADVTVAYKVETAKQNEAAGQDTDSFTSDAPKLKNAGTYTISYKVNATDKGSGTAYAEKAGSITVQITKKELKVKANPCEVYYLDAAPEYSVTYDGLEDGDGTDVVSGQVSFNCDYKAGKPVGTYAITPDVSGLSATNYTFAAVSGNLTVKRKTPAITAVGYENGSDGTQGWKSTTYSDHAPKISFRTDRVGEGNHDAADITFVVTDLTTNQTLEQNTVPVHAGNYRVVASVPASTNYSAATSEAYPFVIHKRTMNQEDFLVEGFEGSYDGGDHAVSVAVNNELLKKSNPQITYKNSDSTTSTESPKFKKVGEYAVGFQVTADNYETYTGSADVKIEKKDLTVTAENKQVTYKEDAREFTAVYDGFVNGETLEKVGGTIRFICEYENGSPVDDYEIQPVVTGLANYEVTANKGTLSVLPRTPKFMDSANLYATRVYDGKAVDLAPTTDGDGKMSCEITNKETNEVLTSDPVDVGKYHVVYSFAAGKNYSAGSVAYDFEIKPAQLKVTAADQKLTYLDEIPEYTAAYDGFVNGENLETAGGTVRFDCSYQKGTTVGSYPIDPEVTGLKNYEVITEAGTLTVERRTPVFTDSANLYEARVYDGKAVDLTPTTDGDGQMSRVITNRETNEILTSDPVDVGEYRVVYSVSEGKNYTEGSVSYDFAITQAPLVITAEDKNVIFGSKAPEFTVVYDGFVNGETEAVLTGTLVVTCDYTKESREFTYAIIPSGLSAKNYAITWKNGVLTGRYPESDDDGYEKTSKPANSNMPKSGQGATVKDAQKGYVNEHSGIVSGNTLTEEMLKNNSESLNDGYSHWIKTNTGWWFRYADGSYPKAAKAANAGSGNSSAAQSHEWVQIDGSWWAFDSNGSLGTGWIFDPVYRNWFYVDSNTGMKTGWVLINGKWYYFNPVSDGTKGIMFANRMTPDGWFVREDGSWDEKR